MKDSYSKTIDTPLGKLHIYESAKAETRNVDDLYEVIVRLLIESAKDKEQAN